MHPHAANPPDAVGGGWDFFAMDTWHPGFAHLASTEHCSTINPFIRQMQLAGRRDSLQILWFQPPTSAPTGLSFRRIWCLESDQYESVVAERK